MRLGDWWWEQHATPREAAVHNVTGRGFVRLCHPTIDTIMIREMGRKEFRVAEQIRHENQAWLEPWDASAPPGYPVTIPTIDEYARIARTQRRAGTLLPLAVYVDGVQVGQVTIGEIVRGASQTGVIGYWISEDYARCGVMSVAVALTLDLAFTQLQLHRVEINVRPNNVASLALVRRLGLRQEGIKERYIHIDCDWAKHLSFAITAEEIPPQGFLMKLRRYH